jgi:hypothetical protein
VQVADAELVTRSLSPRPYDRAEAVLVMAAELTAEQFVTGGWDNADGARHGHRRRRRTVLAGTHERS